MHERLRDSAEEFHRAGIQQSSSGEDLIEDAVVTPREATDLDTSENEISDIVDMVEMTVTNKPGRSSSDDQELSAAKRARINELKKKQKQNSKKSKTNYTCSKTEKMPK